MPGGVAGAQSHMTAPYADAPVMGALLDTGHSSRVLLITRLAMGTAMTFDAIVEIAYPFFTVLSQHILNCVFVTSIAGVAAVISFCMAGCAFDVVVAVQHEGLVVVKGRGFPGFLGMALFAIAGQLLV